MFLFLLEQFFIFFFHICRPTFIAYITSIFCVCRCCCCHRCHCYWRFALLLSNSFFCIWQILTWGTLYVHLLSIFFLLITLVLFVLQVVVKLRVKIVWRRAGLYIFVTFLQEYVVFSRRNFNWYYSLKFPTHLEKKVINDRPNNVQCLEF